MIALLNCFRDTTKYQLFFKFKSWFTPKIFTDTSRNMGAAKQDKLVGAKFMAVKLLLDLPEGCRDEIMQLVSMYGWEGCLNFQTVILYVLVMV